MTGQGLFVVVLSGKLAINGFGATGDLGLPQIVVYADHVADLMIERLAATGNRHGDPR